MQTGEIIAMTDKYVMNTYSRIPIAPVTGAGARLYDADGKEYLDFTAGIAVNSTGHCHPKVVEAICRQAAELLHVSNLYHIQRQAELARVLAGRPASTRPSSATAERKPTKRRSNSPGGTLE